MYIVNLLSYILSFVLIWIGSGLIVTSVNNFTRKLKLSPFAFSFVLLALLTSTPEFSVGLQSIADHTPEIFLGNLLGGILVLFMLVIPLLAILGNGISLKHELDHKTLVATLAVILLPAISILDKKLTSIEGVVFVISYLLLLFMVERKNGLLDKSNTRIFEIKVYSYKDVFKILTGIGIVFISSSIIVEQTIFFARILKISAFYISAVIVALGTDLPELSLAVRSILTRKKEIAMGDYLGSAAISTFLIGLFTILYNGEVLTINNYLVTFIFTLTALEFYYVFFLTKNYISRINGIFLMAVYILFVIMQVFA